MRNIPVLYANTQPYCSCCLAQYGHRTRRNLAMSSNQQFPFRADHVGSLLRPAQLARAREAHAQGQIQATSLHEIEDSVIVDAVRRQEDVGMPVVTGGGFR